MTFKRRFTMTLLQEIIKSLDDLSVEDKICLLNLLKSQLSQNKEKEQIKTFNPDGETFC
ncbi:hypothetical protein [Anabaena sp. UHCC 0204]|uniref:hypothetical protein n=1 Tax=Anabaena sp. UHCC 0204 TaxID=2590009 RepID=UPI0020C208A4|nr:hypothetical protein [Anabaena sp. UHCC 0204]